MKDPKLKIIDLIPYKTAFVNTNHSYTFHVRHESQSLNVSHIAAKVAESFKKYSAQEVAMLVEEFMDVTRDALLDGFVVNTPLFTAQLGVNGTANASKFTQPMNHDDVNIYTSFKQSDEIRRDIRLTKIRVSAQPDTYCPIIASVEPSVGKYRVKQRGNSLMPGMMVTIRGRLLKLMGKHSLVGITLNRVDGESDSYHIQPSMVFPNRPSLLQFLLPADIPAGEWEVTVSTQFGCGRRNVKEPRSTTFDERVTVSHIDTSIE